MAYAPINVDAYTNAYSGAIAGMAISGWIVDPTSSDYSNVATIAGAFARAFDVVWNSATALNWLQIQSIQSVCQEQFAGHAPGSLDNTALAQASNWAVPAAACAALVLQGDAFVTSEGITPNTPGGGSGGGVNQISTTRYVDLNTAIPLADQDGTIGAPFASAIAAVNALKALVPVDGSGTYVLIAFPGNYAEAIVWDPAVSGSVFVIASATGLDWTADVPSGPFPTFLSVNVADGNSFSAKGVIVSDAAGIVCVNGAMQLEGCQVWFAVSSPLGCRFQNCHFVAVDLAVGGGSFLGGTYQSGTMTFPEGSSFMMTDTVCTATAITFGGAGGTLRIDNMTSFWITQSAPVETGVTKVLMSGGGLANLTVATLPPAATSQGNVYMVTDGFDGTPGLAWSDGSQWWLFATRMGTVSDTIIETTIVGGEVTATTPDLVLDTEGGAPTDDLDTINGGVYGQIIRVSAANNAHTVVLKDGTGNLILSGDITLDNSQDMVLLIRYGSWVQLAPVSDNAV